MPADSAIPAPADLDGKKVAVAKGSSANALLVRALRVGGLEWGDAEPIFLLPADAKAAFEGGSVDAWSIWDPYYAAEEAASGARTIATDGSVGSPNRAIISPRVPSPLKNPTPWTSSTRRWTSPRRGQGTTEEVAELVAAETGLP